MGASSCSAAWEAEEGETAMEEMEMEMQPCHGTHHHRLEDSDDHHGWNWTQVGRPVSTKMIGSKLLLREKPIIEND